MFIRVFDLGECALAGVEANNMGIAGISECDGDGDGDVEGGAGLEENGREPRLALCGVDNRKDSCLLWLPFSFVLLFLVLL